MPYKIHRQGSRYVIRKKLAGGGTKVVGHSRSRSMALKAVRARYAGAARKGRK